MDDYTFSVGGHDVNVILSIIDHCVPIVQNSDKKLVVYGFKAAWLFKVLNRYDPITVDLDNNGVLTVRRYQGS